MNQDILSQLRDQIAGAAVSMKQCQGAYKGIKAFKGNQQGLEFCAAQLLQAAGALREAVEQLVVIADTIDLTIRDMPEQLELDDISMDGRV